LKHSVEKTIKSLNVSVFLMKARQAMSKMAAKMKARFQEEVPLHGGACGVGDGIASLTRPS
jgi:hypothetical protein